MYAWLFHRLPGPWPVRLAVLAVAGAAVVAVCFTWVFPAVATLLESGTAVATTDPGV